MALLLREVQQAHNGFDALSAVVNYGGFALLYSVLGVDALWSQRLAIIIAAPVTFFANRIWTFRAHLPAAERQPSADEGATSARNESYSRM